MSEELLFDAIGDIDGAYIESAARRLGHYIAPGGGRRLAGRTLRRVLAGLAAAAALLVLGTLTAVAVSEPVREAVLGFLGFEYSESVPDVIPEGTPVSPEGAPFRTGSETFGGGVSANYYSIPYSVTEPRYGFFFNGTDVWAEDGGEFTQLATKRFDKTLSVRGREVRVTFDYAEHGGACALAWCEIEQLWAGWTPVSRFFSPEAMVITCYIDGENYPVLLDPATGEYADILAGSGLSTLPFNSGYAVPDGSGALVRVEGTWVWYDAERGELTDLFDVSGEHPDFCSLVGGTIACFRYRGSGEEQTVHGWSIDLSTFERRNLFDDMPAGGIILCHAEDFSSPGARFAILLDGGDAVETLDLETGERTPLDGIEMPALPFTAYTPYAGPDGTEIALVTTGTSGHCENITVIDGETGRYYSLDRENDHRIYERWFNWYDADSVAVTGCEYTEEGPEYQTGVNVCFIYEFGE